VTFLFTDIEGSTRLWIQYPAAMPSALARHDALLRTLIERHGGYVFKEVGDAVCAAFTGAADALAASVEGQRALGAESWDVPTGFRVRMAVHAGTAELRNADYFGTTLNRTARILAAGHGGQVLVSLAARELARDDLPPGAALRDLGEVRLRDLTQPERLYQILAPGLATQFPALRSLDARSHNLPVQPTPLVGREEEVRAIHARLAEDGSRLLTLTGPGGTGKTRLALQGAAELLDDFEHGVRAVFLASVRDPAMVLPTIASSLGLRDGGPRPVVEDLVEYLKSKRLLLVLDNFEQVIGAAPDVPRILAACPGVKMLVTSREALRVYGEQELPVPTLACPGLDVPHTPEQQAAYPAVTLFVQRARAVRPAFALTAENAAAVGEICRKLDGLPLAIELAAARVKLFPPAALAERLGRRLDLLTSGPRDLPARQQTLRGAIDWSHELLGESDRAVFRGLAAFVSGAPFDAAEVVCGPAFAGNAGGVEVLAALESLVNKSLLRQSEEGDGEPRVTMLETLREYARERLVESGEAQEVWRRHAAYYRNLAERVEPLLQGGDQPATLALVQREHDNLRAAISRSLASGDVETAARTASAIWWFWWVHGHLREGRDWLERVLAQGEGLPTALRAKVLTNAGGLAYQQGDHAGALSFLEAGLEAARSTGQRAELSRVLGNLGTVAIDMGDYARAESLYVEALAIDRELGDRRGLAYNLGNLGVMAFYKGDDARAAALYQESLDLHRELGDKHSVAVTLNNMGDVARMQGHFERAEKLYNQSLEQVHDLEGRHIQAHVISNLGDLARQQGDLPRARELYADALTAARELGQRREAAITLGGVVSLALAEGRPERTARLAAAVTRLQEEIRYRRRPEERRELEAAVEGARARLGEAAFASAWTAGTAMSFEDVIAYALEEPEAGGGRPNAPLLEAEP
jgi:predicted ATPase/class 3 adenylate cyclase/Tfp pilus assembly protein PilF